jgi:predicted porin
MDKKILFGGAAALMMGFGLFANPASAAIEISHSGEATLKAVMSDTCNKSTASITGNTAFTGTLTASTAPAACVGNEESPVWTTSSKLDWSAAGTLANGLSVSTDQDQAVTLSGAFGSLEFKSGGDSAVKAAMANGQGDVTVAGDLDLAGHSVATEGTAGMVVNYAAPSMGGMDLFLSYAPNSNGSSLDNANYTDTIAFGAKFAVDAITISAGWESATHNNSYTEADSIADNECTAHTNTLATDSGAGTVVAQADTIAGADICGDQTLMMIGAAFTTGGIDINAGWSELDSEEADRTTMNLGLGMSVGDYNLSLDYVNSSLDYFRAVSDEQTVIGVGASTSLGDGVTLSAKFSNNSYNVAGTGAHTNYRTEVGLKVVY